MRCERDGRERLAASSALAPRLIAAAGLLELPQRRTLEQDSAAPFHPALADAVATLAAENSVPSALRTLDFLGHKDVRRRLTSALRTPPPSPSVRLVPPLPRWDRS